MNRRKLAAWASAVLIGLTGALVAATPAQAATCSYQIRASTYESAEGYGAWLYNRTFKLSGGSSCWTRIGVSFTLHPTAGGQRLYRTSDESEVCAAYYCSTGFETPEVPRGEAGVDVKAYNSWRILWRNWTRYFIYNGSTLLGTCDLPRSAATGTCSK